MAGFIVVFVFIMRKEWLPGSTNYRAAKRSYPQRDVHLESLIASGGSARTKRLSQHRAHLAPMRGCISLRDLLLGFESVEHAPVLHVTGLVKRGGRITRSEAGLVWPAKCNGLHPMLIKLGYEIELQLSIPMAVIAVLNVHPSRIKDLRASAALQISPSCTAEEYIDCFGNICTRIDAPQGPLRLSGSTLIEDSGKPDPTDAQASQIAISNLPKEALQFLLASRYCEVDRLSDLAWQLFGNTPPGWARAQAICDWVHQHITFGYHFARPTKTALDVYQERQGVCRDFQHLAITLCRAMHIPARYATGYLGDIGVPVNGEMDFSAWYEVYLGDRWWSFDARNHVPRIGRILMATGRDAADVAITTTFGTSWLNRFSVVTDEVIEPASTIGTVPEEMLFIDDRTMGGGQYQKC